MKQTEVALPEITRTRGRSLIRSFYLYAVTWILRKLVSRLTGPDEGHDRKIKVETPGLGAGYVTCNVWLPAASHSDNSRRPLILIFEGGGFVLGQPKDGRKNNRRIVEQTGAILVSVDYAKAPRYPYPHALLQCHKVLAWCLSDAARQQDINIDSRRVAIGGNSAGGNLTAGLSTLLAFTSGPCALFRQTLPIEFRQVLQFMLYPSLELQHPYQERFARSSPEARAKSLPPWMASIMEESYLPPSTSKDDVFIAPVLADDELLRSLELPPAVILTGSWDCLGIEGKEYAQKLEMAGKKVTFKDYDQGVHGFSNLSSKHNDRALEIYNSCWTTVCKALKDAFA